MAQGRRDLTYRGLSVRCGQWAIHDSVPCAHKHFIICSWSFSAQTNTLFAWRTHKRLYSSFPLSVRSFRPAKWERRGMDGGRKRGREGGKEVEGREEERGRSRLGDPS